MTARNLLSCILAAGASICVPAAARASQTIVGTWAPDPAECTPVAGMVSIGPLSLTADETSCNFDNVSRAGDVVTWHGRCSGGEASGPATVVAVLHGKRLTFTLNGGRNGPYLRCTPR